MSASFRKDVQYYRFCLYGFLKNLRFFEVFLVLFFLENGLSFFEIGLLYAVREIFVNIFEIPSGILADTFGRKRTLILSFGFYILSFIIFFYSWSFVVFMIAMILFSMGDAFRSGNHKAMIYHYLSHKGWGDQKVHYYGLTRSWSQMGSALSALSGAALVFYSGSYRYIFLYSMIPYVIDMINVASYPRFLEGQVKKADWREMGHNFAGIFKKLLRSLKSFRVVKMIGSLAIYSGYYKAIKDLLQPVIAIWALSLPFLPAYTSEQRSSVFIGIIFFIVYLLSSWASRSAGKFSESFSNYSAAMNVSLLIGLIGGVLSGFFFVLDLGMLSIVLFIAIYMIENIRKPVGVAFLANSINKEVVASVLSVDSQVKSIAAAVLAPLFGIFADLYGLGWGILIVSTMLLLLSPLVLLKKNN